MPRDHRIRDEQLVSFVPMAAVDETSGTIRDRLERKFSEVRKGYTHFMDGDVLFAKITPCMENGKAAIATDLTGGIGFGSTEFHVLRAKKMVLPEWLCYFVRQPAFRIEAKRNFTGTAGQQRVPTTFVSSATIPVPPLTEQRRIVDLLSRAEGIVRLRREAQAKAQAIIPALFVDMFGDPATNPKGWSTQPLRSLVEFRSGGTPSKARPDFWVGDLPWVSPKDMKVTALRDAADKISRVVLEETSLKLIPPGSILIVVRGMILVHTVPVALAEVPLSINQDLKALIPCADLNPAYLLWSLKVMHDHLLGMVSTAAHGTKKLETARLEDLALPLPPSDLQRTFAQRSADVGSILAQQEEALKAAERTFESLLAQSFRSDTRRPSIRHNAERAYARRSMHARSDLVDVLK